MGSNGQPTTAKNFTSNASIDYIRTDPPQLLVDTRIYGH